MKGTLGQSNKTMWHTKKVFLQENDRHSWWVFYIYVNLYIRVAIDAGSCLKPRLKRMVEIKGIPGLPEDFCISTARSHPPKMTHPLFFWFQRCVISLWKPWCRFFFISGGWGYCKIRVSHGYQLFTTGFHNITLSLGVCHGQNLCEVFSIGVWSSIHSQEFMQCQYIHSWESLIMVGVPSTFHHVLTLAHMTCQLISVLMKWQQVFVIHTQVKENPIQNLCHQSSTD